MYIHFFPFLFFYSNPVIEIRNLHDYYCVTCIDSFINRSLIGHGRIIALTQFFVSIEEIAEPDLHAADRGHGFEMFHDPSVVHYVA